MTYPKKLIEVALPLDAINAASAREKSIRHGHPSNLHRWWARRPLAAARAVIFAQMVDDPSAHPERFPTEAEQEHERLRLFRIIEQLVLWENTTNEDVLNAARDEIWKSWRATCAANRDHPRAAELFDPDRLPAFHDPFAGGGALPLEAQRLGLEAYASDLNPVAVLINKAMIEIPPKFANRPPVNPEARRGLFFRQDSRDAQDGKKKKNPVNPVGNSVWRGAQGLAEDIRYYGQWMRDEAEKRIGHLYPKITVTTEMAQERPGLKPYVGRELTVIAWLWARTVKSPNPAFADVDVPLAATFILSKKAGKETYVEPVIEGRGYRFTVKVGKPPKSAENGTKLARGANFECLMSGSPISGDYIKAEGKAGRMSARLMAIVAEGDRGRVYLAPTPEHESIVQHIQVTWEPDGTLVKDARAFTPTLYGLVEWRNLFTPRQIVTLTIFSDLVQEVRAKVSQDCLSAGCLVDSNSLQDTGSGECAYADAVATYLAIALSKTADSNNTLCPWEPVAQCTRQLFGRQAISMLWDYSEANALHYSSGGLPTNVAVSIKAFDAFPQVGIGGICEQIDATHQTMSHNKVISTDPPYYDNVPYADLSDFFYVWLRRSLISIFPTLFATLVVPKTGELVAFDYQHGSKENAESFFLNGMTHAMRRLAEQSHPACPITIYYAFKQSETEGQIGTVSTGWDTFLNAVICAGLTVSGTWPMRTEMTAAMKSIKNSLASSIVLVCRKRSSNAPTATRREFLTALRAELPRALKHLQRSNIAPVDLAQAAIGPGMGVFTRYTRVLDAAGQPMSVREALALINQTLDEVLAEQEGDFDPETRWAVAWFEQMGFNEGPFGDAETLSKAKNTSVETLAEAGLLASRAGKVRLFRPSELPAEWQPKHDARLTIWEMTHHLIRVLEKGGESGAAALAAQLGSQAEAARELAYRLYTVCERKKRAQEALAYNALVQSWPEITRLAAEKAASMPRQESLF